MLKIILVLLLALCLGYYFIVIKLSNSIIWLLIAAIAAGNLVFLYVPKRFEILKYLMIALSAFAAVAFCISVGRVCVNLKGNPAKNLDYVIVLGAQIKGTTLSEPLQQRCDTAVQYLKDNPGTVVIVSGGKGTDEQITEAEAMKLYFVSRGIDASRIIEEGMSTNTSENIKYSLRIITNKEGSLDNVSVGIISSNYHLKRARYILHKNGADTIHCIPAKTEAYTLPHYVVREAVGLYKEYLSFSFLSFVFSK